MNVNRAIKIPYLILMAFAILMMGGSCKKEKEVFEPTLMLGANEMEVSGKGSEQYLEFLTNSSWSLSTEVSWIDFSETEGEKGKHKIKFEVEENEGDERVGTISITADNGLKEEVVVTQSAGVINVFYVTENGTGDGRSWEEATDLQSALDEATSGSTIHIGAGVYRPSKTIRNGDSANDSDNTFEIKSNITLIGGYPSSPTDGDASDPTVHETIFSGKQANGAESFHVMVISAPAEEGEKVVVKGITLTEGHGSDRGTTITINDIGFRRGNGAGLNIGGSKVELDQVRIIDNKTSDAQGSVGQAAGVFISSNAEVVIRNSQINDNVSASNGGGLWIDRSKVFIYDTEVNGNSGGTAAGVHAYPDATVYMYNCLVQGNKGRAYGTGVYMREGSVGVLVNTLITDNENTTKNGGGGVMLYQDSKVDIINSTITNNSIPDGPGGGVYSRAGVNTVKIVNSIISGNKQLSSSADVDAFETTADAPDIKGSVIDNKVYDEGGSEVPNTSFSPTSMLSTDYRLTGSDNPAKEYGMPVGSLTALINQYSPALEESYITKDLKGKSREGGKVMGVYIE